MLGGKRLQIIRPAMGEKVTLAVIYWVGYEHTVIFQDDVQK